MVLVVGAQPALAATSRQFAAFAAGEAWYNAGDHDMSYGPNTFVLNDYRCDRFIMYVQYSWAGESGDIQSACGDVRIRSLAPLGPNPHPLRWRTCGYDIRNIPMVRCGAYIDDIVYTN